MESVDRIWGMDTGKLGYVTIGRSRKLSKSVNNVVGRVIPFQFVVRIASIT